MKIVLIIDTSNNKEISLSLKKGGQLFTQKSEFTNRKAQQVLPMAEEMLKKHGVKLQDLTDIEVNTGPGSFTGLRVGIAIANTFGYLLNIPVNGKKPGETVDAVYS
jgi:tRNA threonylcarbamoyladenosine biosynthesis protein TsaB